MSAAYEKNIYRQVRNNIIRTWVIVVCFTSCVLAIGYGFALYYEDVSLIMAAIAGALFSNVSSYFFSEKIALSSSGARKARRDVPEELRLIRSVETMAITAGIPTPGVYVIDDSALNAFATGRNPNHASVAFTSGILNVLDKNELEGVVAHELSHIKNRDILVGTIVVVLVGFVALLADLFIRSGFAGKSGDSKGGSAAGVIILVGIVCAVLAPLIGRLIQFAVTRKREYLADASGALLTRYPEGLASALVKINNNGQPLKKTSQATSHLFIANPLGIKKQSFTSQFSSLFSTHPPMEKRVEALLGEEMKNELLGFERDKTN